MSKNIAIALGMAIIVGLGFWYFSTHKSVPHTDGTTEATSTPSTVQESFVLQSTNGSIGTITYTTQTKDVMLLTVGTTTVELKQAVSASGSRYTNADESIVWWEHGGEGTLEMNGTSTAVSGITAATTITMEVAPEQQHCVGVGPRECLVVNGQLFYDNIIGFEFVPGTAYTLEVARTERANPPADASSYEYTLINIVSATTPTKTNAIYFDSTTKEWKDTYGVCHTCTPETGFGADGELIDLNANEPETPLTAHSWQWQSTAYADGDTVTPTRDDAFVLTFTKDNRFSATTDCNGITGTYSTEGSNLTLSQMGMTLMFCADSQEQVFVDMLSDVSAYTVTNNGSLALTLSNQAGIATFTPVKP